jgi:hypothetical protein
MIDSRTITAQICACFERLARSSAPTSSLGHLADGTTGMPRQQQVAAGRHDAAMIVTVDRLNLFRHCNERDIEILVEKYHNAPEQREVVRSVPGRSHGRVRVGYRCATFQSDTSCARALGMRSAHSFKRALTRARERVRQALAERSAA